MKLIYLFFAACFLTAASASAQVLLAPEAGYNVCHYTGSTDNNSRKTFDAYAAGFNLNFALSQHFSLMPGIFYVRNGYTCPYRGQNLFEGMNTFQVPLSLEYQIGPDYSHFFIGAGPYVDFYQDGIVKLTGTLPSSRDMRIGNGAADDINHWDYGAQGWVMIQIVAGLYVRGTYLQGFNNLTPNYNAKNGSADSKHATYNQDLRATLGYAFTIVPKKEYHDKNGKVITKKEWKKERKEQKQKDREKEKKKKKNSR
jgi:hypothetical protein